MEVVSAASTGGAGGGVGGKTSSSDAEIHESKPFSVISNGVLKRHLHTTAAASFKDGVVYRECLKNHAASLGAHAVDGCGEFMPSPGSNPADPTSLKCAACGCHRNFHRQESGGDALTTSSSAVVMVPSSNCSPPLAIEYQPHNRHRPLPPPPPPPLPPQLAHQPPLPQPSHSSPSGSESPPPISSSYYPSAPHLLLTLSGGMSSAAAAAAAAAAHQDHITTPPGGGTRSAPPPGMVSHSNGRKRFRTRFTQEQKVEMLDFADKLDWKMQRKDEGLITEFCNKIGVERGVFKVWMHNNKNYPGTGTGAGTGTSNGKSTSSVPIPSTISATTTTTTNTNNNSNNGGIKIAQQNLGGDKEINDHFQEQQSRPRQDDDSFSSRVVVAPYGSSSSS